MIRCDVFDLSVTLSVGPPRLLRWELLTDLPVGARCTLSAERSYEDEDGLLALWTLSEEQITITRRLGYDLNGATGEIDVDQGDIAALAELLSDDEAFAGGMQCLPSDEIEVSCILGSPQPLPAFGRYNANLVGEPVTILHDLHVIDVSEIVMAPLADHIAPDVSERP